MKRGRLVSIVSVLLCLVLALSGCSKPPTSNTGNATIDAMDIQTMADTLVRALSERKSALEELDVADAEIVRLNTLVQGVVYLDPEFPSITKLEDETNRAVFNKPGSYIILPDPIMYPGVEPLAVQNRIVMGGDVGIVISNISPVWMYRLEGNRLYLSSSTGVYGEITIGKIRGEYDPAMVSVIFDGHPGQEEEVDAWGRVTTPYIAQSDGLKNLIPADPGKGNGKDGAITWINRPAGRQIVVPTSVGGTSATMRVGAYAGQNLSMVYSFVYETTMNDANEALILALLTSISISGRNIALEF